MSASRKRLAKGISASSFVRGTGAISAALSAANLRTVVRLSYGSDDVSAVLGLAPFAIADRKHFMLQGRLAIEPLAAADRFAAAARATANFEHTWGSWLFSIARDGQGARSVNFSKIVQPGQSPPSFLDVHLTALLRDAGAVEHHGCLRLDGRVRLEMWGGTQERFHAREMAADEGLVDEIVSRILTGITESRRVLVTLKSRLEDFQSWLTAGIISPASDFRPLASYEVEVGDLRSNVEPARFEGLAGKLDAELGSSEGVLELLVLDGAEPPSPVGSIHFGWSRQGSEAAWVPIARDRTQLQRAWEVIKAAAVF